LLIGLELKTCKGISMNEFIKNTIELFNEKGIKFTVAELATRNKMSKKTIYKEYGDKEKVIELSILAVFESIKEQEKAIENRRDLSTIGKLKGILSVFPSFTVNYERVHEIRDSYPEAYQTIVSHLESNWDGTERIFKQAIDEGVLKAMDYGTLKLIVLGIYNEIVDLEVDEQQRVLSNCLDLVLYGHIVEEG